MFLTDCETSNEMHQTSIGLELVAGFTNRPNPGECLRKLIQEIESTRFKRGHCTMSALAKEAATMPILSQLSETECNAFLFSHFSMLQRGLQCTLSSHRVFHRIFEKFLRYLKLATSAFTKYPSKLRHRSRFGDGPRLIKAAERVACSRGINLGTLLPAHHPVEIHNLLANAALLLPLILRQRAKK